MLLSRFVLMAFVLASATFASSLRDDDQEYGTSGEDAYADQQYGDSGGYGDTEGDYYGAAGAGSADFLSDLEYLNDDEMTEEEAEIVAIASTLENPKPNEATKGPVPAILARITTYNLLNNLGLVHPDCRISATTLACTLQAALKVKNRDIRTLVTVMTDHGMIEMENTRDESPDVDGGWVVGFGAGCGSKDGKSSKLEGEATSMAVDMGGKECVRVVIRMTGGADAPSPSKDKKGSKKDADVPFTPLPPPGDDKASKADAASATTAPDAGAKPGDGAGGLPAAPGADAGKDAGKGPDAAGGLPSPPGGASPDASAPKDGAGGLPSPPGGATPDASGASPTTPGGPAPDGAAPKDGASPDGAPKDGAPKDGASPSGTTPDAGAPANGGDAGEPKKKKKKKGKKDKKD